uniref:Uncharacterized protein n=1 Tax=Megaselia scalaris TaxID=36166 RepID=T1GL10_MEGSC
MYQTAISTTIFLSDIIAIKTSCENISFFEWIKIILLRNSLVVYLVSSPRCPLRFCIPIYSVADVRTISANCFQKILTSRFLGRVDRCSLRTSSLDPTAFFGGLVYAFLSVGRRMLFMQEQIHPYSPHDLPNSGALYGCFKLYLPDSPFTVYAYGTKDHS